MGLLISFQNNIVFHTAYGKLAFEGNFDSKITLITKTGLNTETPNDQT